MKILNAEQLRAIDAYTILNEPVTSLELMERAARACLKRIVKLARPDEKIQVLCGKGNNGGDGLAITRLLLDLGYDCSAFVINYTDKFSDDAQANFTALKEKFPAKLIEINTPEELKEKLLPRRVLIIDALLGTGINKAAGGFLAETIDYLNANFSRIISIDVPSGLFIDKSSSDSKHIIHSSLTLSFQVPKLAFMFAENKAYVKEFEILDINLHKTALANAPGNNYYITRDLIVSLLQTRSKFSHKGNYGHALLMAGSKGKSGAGIISARAAMRSGVGLLTVQSTKETLLALLNRLPEAMAIEDEHTDHISGIEKPETYDAIAFGPGVGQHADTESVLKKLLQCYSGKLVIDADGLNILSENKTWLTFLPPSCILTPHPKEFERLCGKQESDFERLETLRQFAMKNRCIVI